MKLTLNTAFSLEVSVTKYISVNCNSVYTPTREEILSFKNVCASFTHLSLMGNDIETVRSTGSDY